MREKRMQAHSTGPSARIRGATTAVRGKGLPVEEQPEIVYAEAYPAWSEPGRFLFYGEE
jgi:hypothetical protein